MKFQSPDYVRSMAPYQAGKPISELAREYGLNEAEIVKLASNENPLGMPNLRARRCWPQSANWAAIPMPTGSN